MRTEPHGGRGNNSNPARSVGSTNRHQGQRQATAAAAAALAVSDVPLTPQEAEQIAIAGVDYADVAAYTQLGLSVSDILFAAELGLSPADVAASTPSSADTIDSDRHRVARYNRYLDEIQAGLSSSSGFRQVGTYEADQEAVAPPGYAYVTCALEHPHGRRMVQAQVRIDVEKFGTSRASQVHIAHQLLTGGSEITDVANPHMLDRPPNPEFAEHVDVLLTATCGVSGWVRWTFERRHWFG